MNIPLNPDDTFFFECQMCGSCCRDNRLIVLNPEDVFSLSRALGLSTTCFIKQFCEDGGGFGVFPVLALKTPGGACIFLEENLCGVHSSRPACCANYPVGTSFGPDGGQADALMPPSPGCSGFEQGGSHTASSWRAASGIDPLSPGISLFRNAFRKARGLPSGEASKKRLFSILYDFDPLPELRATHQSISSFGEIAPLLARLLEKMP